MKLYYYQEFKNFGDIFNPWLWPKLLPNVFDEDSSSIFVGIGTLLNDYIPQESFKVVFGAGVGYGKSLPVIDENWNVYCVRGPLSAQALALKPEMAITDPAVLLHKFDLPKKRKCYSVSFMPHWQSAHWNWESVCRKVDLHFINPMADVEQVLHDIQSSELVIAEAMHGAIVADALRVPWIPVQANKWILEFKWHDWCQSLGLQYKPIRLPRLYSDANGVRLIRKKLQNMGLYHNAIFTRFAQSIEVSVDHTLKIVNNAISNQIARILKRAIEDSTPILSSDQTISSVTSRLEEKLEQFKVDYISGRLMVAPNDAHVKTISVDTK